MIKEAIEHILSLRQVENFVLDGRTYTSGQIEMVRPPKYQHPEGVVFNTLSGLVDYVAADIDVEVVRRTETEAADNIDFAFLHVADVNTVNLVGEIQPENYNKRFCYASAKLKMNSFEFGKWFNLESFVIALQSQFIQTEQRDRILAMVGSIAAESSIKNSDDTFSQSLEIQTGITTKAHGKITNPIKLKPYRTFREVDQPESQFVLRFQKANYGKSDQIEAALFEADGGTWKIKAMNNIVVWLKQNAPDTPVLG